MLNAGYHAVPPGMIATVVTSLEMLELPTFRPEAPDPNWRLDRLAPDLTEYRRLYRAVGEDWLWFSRLLLSDAELAAIIGSAITLPLSASTSAPTSGRSDGRWRSLKIRDFLDGLRWTQLRTSHCWGHRDACC